MSSERTVSARLSNASSSPKSPGTNRKPSARCRHTSSRNGVRACCFTASYTIWPKSWSAQSRRANPVSAKPGGSRPRLVRSYTAGMSFLRARSPVTPKMTSPHGPAMRGRRRSRGSRSGLLSAETFDGLTGRSRSRRTVLRLCSLRGLPARRRLLAEASGHGRQELLPALLELRDALVLELRGDPVDRDAEPLDAVEQRGRGRLRAGDGVAPDDAVVRDRVQRGLGHRVDDARDDELLDVPRVVVGLVLDAGRRPERPLRVGAG